MLIINHTVLKDILDFLAQPLVKKVEYICPETKT